MAVVFGGCGLAACGDGIGRPIVHDQRLETAGNAAGVGGLTSSMAGSGGTAVPGGSGGMASNGGLGGSGAVGGSEAVGGSDALGGPDALGGSSGSGGMPGSSGGDSGGRMGGAGFQGFDGGRPTEDDLGGRGNGFMDGPYGPGASPDDVPSTGACADVASWDDDAANTEQELLRFLNFARDSGSRCGSDPHDAVTELVMQPELRCAARLHSKDMSERNFFDHVNPDGEGPEERMRAAGYVFAVSGESIERLRVNDPMGDRYQALSDLLSSGGPDCQSLLDERFDAVGVGVYGELLTLDFAGP
ncbi:MAG TPA: CAP domain-containing protein [Polyangiaceae bacterium]|nr:CAP domain-containing protein [Polyangiaceae bacterium]